MTFRLRSMAAVAVLAAFSLAAAGCSQPAANTAAANTAAPAAGDAATPTGATATADANIPAECQTYLNHLQACVDHAATANPAGAAQYRSQMEQVRSQMASNPNPEVLNSVCHTMNTATEASFRQAGC